jgi:hypothetical protein
MFRRAVRMEHMRPAEQQTGRLGQEVRALTPLQMAIGRTIRPPALPRITTTVRAIARIPRHKDPPITIQRQTETVPIRRRRNVVRHHLLVLRREVILHRQGMTRIPIPRQAELIRRHQEATPRQRPAVAIRRRQEATPPQRLAVAIRRRREAPPRQLLAVAIRRRREAPRLRVTPRRHLKVPGMVVLPAETTTGTTKIPTK